jgi:hypothetical protein
VPFSIANCEKLPEGNKVFIEIHGMIFHGISPWRSWELRREIMGKKIMGILNITIHMPSGKLT